MKFSFMVAACWLVALSAYAATDFVSSGTPPLILGQVGASGQGGPCIAFDSAGNRYVVGTIGGAITNDVLDFNPFPGIDALPVKGINQFITRFNADGSYAWTQTANTGDAIAVAVSPDGMTIYWTGAFRTSLHTGASAVSVSTVGSGDVFVVALDASTGAPKSAFGLNGTGIQRFGGSGDDSPYGIVVTDTAVYVVGDLQSKDASIGAGGSLGIKADISSDAFILALDPITGAPLQNFGLNNTGVQLFGGSNTDRACSVVASGNTLFLAGKFCSANARIGATANAVSSTSSSGNAFIAALDSSTGQPITTFGLNASGVQTFGGTGSDRATAISTNGAALFVGGLFSSHDAKVGQSGVVISSESAPYPNAFVLALDPGLGAPLPAFGVSNSGVAVLYFSGNGSSLATMEGLASSSDSVYAVGRADGTTLRLSGHNFSSISAGGYIAAFDAASGGAQAAFGPDSSGVQSFGSNTYEDACRAAVVQGHKLFAAGYTYSTFTVGIGGAATYTQQAGLTWSYQGFLLPLDADSGAFSPYEITQQPSDLNVFIGQKITLTVTAVGNGLSYQWRKDGTNISGATSRVFAINSAALSDAARYDVVITGSLGSTISRKALVTVYGPPAIVVQPSDNVATQGDSITFDVEVSGYSVAFQWSKDNQPISGATSATFSIDSVAVLDTGNYQLTASNPAGSVVSRMAALTVSGSPVIISEPVSTEVFATHPLALNVSALGGDLSYQWRLEGVPITGAANSSYALAHAALSDAGQYDVVVSNSFGSVTSSAVVVVIDGPPVITLQPKGGTVYEAHSFSLTVGATGLQLGYQWRKGSPLSGATSPTYSVAQADATNSGTYTVVVSNPAGQVTSSAAVIVVTADPNKPMFASPPTPNPNPAVVGQVVTFSSTATSPLSLTNAWNFGDGTSATGNTVAHVYSPVGTYTVNLVATNTESISNSIAFSVPVTAATTGIAVLPGELDSDGDGYSDNIENAAATSALSLTDSPAAGATPVQTLILKPKVAAAGTVASVIGSLVIPAGFVVKDRVMLVDLNGTVRRFVLTPNGSSKVGRDEFKIAVKLTQKKVLAQNAKFSVKLYNVPPHPAVFPFQIVTGNLVFKK